MLARREKLCPSAAVLSSPGSHVPALGLNPHLLCGSFALVGHAPVMTLFDEGIQLGLDLLARGDISA
jgi:hypothetical protein